MHCECRGEALEELEGGVWVCRGSSPHPRPSATPGQAGQRRVLARQAGVHTLQGQRKGADAKGPPGTWRETQVVTSGGFSMPVWEHLELIPVGATEAFSQSSSGLLAKYPKPSNGLKERGLDR